MPFQVAVPWAVSLLPSQPCLPLHVSPFAVPLHPSSLYLGCSLWPAHSLLSLFLILSFPPAPEQVPARHGARWCRCHLEWVLCRCDQSRERALALLHQSLALRTEIFISVGSAVLRTGGGSSHPTKLRRASWPARAESRHFLHGYLFWESSKISGSQFNCATSQLPERVEYDHITWNACRVCYSNCISKRQHIWWLVLFGIISISWWCFIHKGCSLKG